MADDRRRVRAGPGRDGRVPHHRRRGLLLRPGRGTRRVRLPRGVPAGPRPGERAHQPLRAGALRRRGAGRGHRPVRRAGPAPPGAGVTGEAGRIVSAGPRPENGAGAGYPARSLRSRLQLLAGRSGQLRRGPGSSRAGDRRQSGDRRRTCGPTGRSWSAWCATWPRSAASGSSWTSAAGCPTAEQHPRGGAGGRAGRADRLRGQRPHRAVARPDPADQHPGRERATTSRRTCGTPRPILRAASATLDFGEPVALMLLIILHLIPDADDPYGIVARLVGAMPAGSYLVLAHPASDIRAAEMAEMTKRVNQRMSGPAATMRDRAAITRFFGGLELLEPGVVQPQQWRPEPGDPGPPQVTAGAESPGSRSSAPDRAVGQDHSRGWRRRPAWRGRPRRRCAGRPVRPRSGRARPPGGCRSRRSRPPRPGRRRRSRTGRPPTRTPA